MKKATAVAPSNIAFIKYWGKKNEDLRIPENGSISMNLSNIYSATTVEFNARLKKDDITIDNGNSDREINRVIRHLDLIRKIANISLEAKVVSKNNFPASTGLSSSASGFAALTLAASNAAGLNLSKRELSILARVGSGSACRSIPDGFVEWVAGYSNETSYAYSIFPANHWDILDIIVIVSDEKKTISSTEGQKLIYTSPFFKSRLAHIKQKLNLCKKLLKEKKFTGFGELIEAEALELHAIMLTSRPSLIYWLPATMRIMHLVKQWRKEGLSVYFTVNTGQDIHLIIESKDRENLLEKLNGVKEIKKVIVNRPSSGSRLSEKHLF